MESVRSSFENKKFSNKICIWVQLVTSLKEKIHILRWYNSNKPKKWETRHIFWSTVLINNTTNTESSRQQRGATKYCSIVWYSDEKHMLSKAVSGDSGIVRWCIKNDKIVWVICRAALNWNTVALKTSVYDRAVPGKFLVCQVWLYYIHLIDKTI